MLKVYVRSQESGRVDPFNRLSMRSRYILDKVLHNNKFSNTNLIQSPNLYSIFLIREPQRSLASICELKPKWTPEKALHYYAGRLAALEGYVRSVNSKERSLFITYDQLVSQSDLVFSALKNLLETKESFSEEYQVLKTTGMKSIGDSQGNIKAGRIIRDKRKLSVNIASELTERGMQAFEQCSKTLTEYCRMIDRAEM